MEEFLPKVSTYLSLSSFASQFCCAGYKKGKVVGVVTKRDLMKLIKDQYAVFFPKVVVG